jgi:hypothetical protein
VTRIFTNNVIPMIPGGDQAGDRRVLDHLGRSHDGCLGLGDEFSAPQRRLIDDVIEAQVPELVQVDIGATGGSVGGNGTAFLEKAL